MICKVAKIQPAKKDVTRRREADREKDDLLQAKEILLQEMQHRVANSLQIIASILLLKARTVQSEETWLHLHDALNATVQKRSGRKGTMASIIAPRAKSVKFSKQTARLPDVERVIQPSTGIRVIPYWANA